MVQSINFRTAGLLYSPKLTDLCVCNSSDFHSQLFLFYIYTPEVTHSLLNMASCKKTLLQKKDAKYGFQFAQLKKKSKAKAQSERAFVATAELSKTKFVDIAHIFQYVINNSSKINHSLFAVFLLHQVFSEK